MSKIDLAQVQLAAPVPFNGNQTSSLLASQATALYYDSEEELVYARSKREGAPILLIPETNVLYMVEYIAPPEKPAQPASPAAPAPKSDVIKAVAPGVTVKK